MGRVNGPRGGPEAYLLTGCPKSFCVVLRARGLCWGAARMCHTSPARPRRPSRVTSGLASGRGIVFMRLTSSVNRVPSTWALNRAKPRAQFCVVEWKPGPGGRKGPYAESNDSSVSWP